MSNEEEAISEAKATVLRFASEWTAWELEMAKDEESMLAPVMIETHANLIKTHCTIKKRVYADDLSCYSEPPTYADVVEDNIFNVAVASKNRVHVDVKCTFKNYRFVVVRKKDGWRIDSIKWNVTMDSPWKNGLIGS